MIEHTAWVGADYKLGLSGSRIAIVGFSHHLGDDGGEDSNDGTIQCIRNVISGEWKIAFFTQIRNYFGFANHDAYWQRVIFFNYLPDSVGDGSQRYGHGTPEQRSLAQVRFVRILNERIPQKVLIFTGRHWAFPDVACEQLSPQFPKFWHGIYSAGNHKITAFFLRHPQGASGDLMRRAVKDVLDRPNPIGGGC